MRDATRIMMDFQWETKQSIKNALMPNELIIHCDLRNNQFKLLSIMWVYVR